MSSSPQRKHQFDEHQISLDLDGLDEFLEATEEIIAGPEPTEVAAAITATSDLNCDERQLLLQLLGQVAEVNRSVEEARERLASANERMTSLATVVQIQTGQLELLSHYQNQAARVTSLERQIAELQSENAKLKRSWWQKLVSVFRK